MRYRVIALCSLACACRDGNDRASDSGTGEVALALIDHVAQVADRMTDQRFRAQLYAELAVADHLAHAGAAKDRVDALLLRGANVAVAVTTMEDQDLALEKVAIAHGKVGKIDGGAEVAARIKNGKTRSRALAEIADAAARQKDFDRALAIASKISEPEEKSWAHGAISRALIDAGEIKRGVETLRKCGMEEHANEALAALSKEHARRGNMKQAEEVAESISSGHFRGEASEAIARAFFEKNEKQKADRIVARIESSWLQSRAYAQGARIARTRGRKERDRQTFGASVVDRGRDQRQSHARVGARGSRAICDRGRRRQSRAAARRTFRIARRAAKDNRTGGRRARRGWAHQRGCAAREYDRRRSVVGRGCAGRDRARGGGARRSLGRARSDRVDRQPRAEARASRARRGAHRHRAALGDPVARKNFGSEGSGFVNPTIVLASTSKYRRCAGAYKVESLGIVLFEEMRGPDHTAIVGLPITAVADLFHSAGFDLFSRLVH